MRKLSDPNRGIIGALSRLGDLMILNILFIVCSLPVVTMGASLTALCSVTLQFCEGTESYTVRSFFKVFRAEFKQATIIWLAVLAVVGILCVDLRAISAMKGAFGIYFRVIFVICCIFLVMFVTYVFFLQAKLINRVPATMKNAVFMAVANFPRTVWMLLLDAAILFVMFYNVTTLTAGCLIFALGGFAGLNFVDAHLIFPALNKIKIS